ncbi:transposase [Sorangium sp. So ce429]
MPIAKDIHQQRLRIAELHIDRAYVNSPVVGDVIRAKGKVFSKPWGQRARGPDLFSKRHFNIDLRTKTITCPAGQVEAFEPGDTVEFDPEECGACPLRTRCTQAASGRGRTVSIAEDEALQSKFRELQQTAPGRAVLRQRTAVEHALAHIAARKGHSARYMGARKNLFDLRRAAAIQNIEAAQRLVQEAA